MGVAPRAGEVHAAPPDDGVRILFLRLLKFRDGLGVACSGDGEGDPVASVHGVQQRTVLGFELFCDIAIARSHGAVLGLLNHEGPVRPIEFS